MRGPVGAVLCLLLSPVVALADGVSIDHQGVGCVVAGKFPRFDARLDPADAVARVRLHFRPEGGPHWYFVEMKPEAGVFSGILPKPQKTLHRFSYYIDVLDKGFNETRTAEFAPDVAAGPAACGREKVLAAGLTKANVLVHAPEGVAGLPAAPAGFAGDGVAAAGSAGIPKGAAEGAGGGLGSTALILGGVAVAGGTAAVIATTSKGDGGSSNSSPSSQAYNVAFTPLLDVSICAGGSLFWSGQTVDTDTNGNFDTTWAPMRPNTMHVTGRATATAFDATLNCVNGAASGSISATGSGGTYGGTYSFAGSGGAVTVTRK